MNEKKPSFDLQPAPRPRVRLTEDQMQSVNRAAGPSFDRTLNRSATALSDPATGAGQHRRPPALAEPTPPPPEAKGLTIRGGPEDSLLKLKVPDALGSALKHEAVRRKVTVRFLVLEALASAGYAFDFSGIPEDGRRLR